MARPVPVEENGLLKKRRDLIRRFLEAGMGKERIVKEKGVKSVGEHSGMSTADHRHGSERKRIRFAAARTDLGWILVAGTARGLSVIHFGDSRRELIDGMKARVGSGEYSEGDPETVRWLRRVEASIASPRRTLDIPLDIRGTSFQRRVWRELRRIPVGGTASYGEVARRIGKPGSARAVAQACAANPLAVAVPCHRVVRSDGGLGGYRGGVERKRALLEREAGIASGDSRSGSV
jgi:AraC family transcriptional regulator of adaptative response/methylated-DNA-[protein]-cysteine methyltransferase